MYEEINSAKNHMWSEMEKGKKRIRRQKNKHTEQRAAIT